jgi:HSP20 family protein
MSIIRRAWPTPFPQVRGPWVPPADVYRTRDGWILKFDLAGVQVQDVRITISGRRVTIDGVVEEGWSYYAMEISYDRFARTIEMPSCIDEAQVSMETRNGILLVRMVTEGNENG